MALTPGTSWTWITTSIVTLVVLLSVGSPRWVVAAELVAVRTGEDGVTNDATDGAREIRLNDVPLREVIRSFARALDLNVILDPHVPGADCAIVSGREEPRISKHWTSITCLDALRTVLKENQLILVTNSVTTVARIAPGSVAVRPVPVSALGTDGESATNQSVIPLIVIDGVPLFDVIRNIARQAGLTPFFHRDLGETFAGRNTDISVRWENLTARQALAAVIDNYGLVMVENVAAHQIFIRPRTQGSAARQQRPK